MKSSLNRSSKRFDLVFKALPMPTYLWEATDNDFELIEANDAAVKDFSIKKQVSIGIKASEFYEKIPSILEDLNDCLSKKKSSEKEVIINLEDDFHFHFSLFSFTYIDAKTVLVQSKETNSQKPIFFDSDVHDQLLANFIQDNPIPIPISMLDNDLRYIAASKNWLTRFKLKEIDLKGKYHFDIFPEISEDWKSLLQRCLKGAVESRDEDSFIRIDGNVEWVKWEVRPWYKKSREIGGILIFSEVITERKNAEEKIKKDAEKLNKILENLPFGLSIENNKNETTFFNKSMIDILGYQIEEIPNVETWFEKTIPNSTYRKQVEKEWNEKVENSIKTNTKCSPLQVTVRCKNGSYKIVEMCFSSIGDEYVTICQDVTELKNKEFQIQEVNEIIVQQNKQLIQAKSLAEESELRLIEAQKASKTGNWETDLQTLNVIWSAETYAIFELDQKTFSPTHQSFLTFVHPDDQEMVDAAFVNSFKTKHYNTIEHRITTSRGNLKYVEERWKVSFNEQGVPILVFGTTQDITERKLIEIELIKTKIKVQQNEHRLKLALNAAKLGVWEWNIDNGKLIWDDKMYEMHGLNKHEKENFNLNDWISILHPEDREQAILDATLTLEKEMPYDTSFRVLKQNGEVVYIKSDAKIIKDKNGKLHNVIGVSRDITEKNLREKALQEKELKYRTLFENSVDAIILFAEGKNVDCNESALKLFGTTREKFLNWHPKNYSPKYQSDGTLSEDDINKRIPAVFEGKSQHFEWEHCKEDGTVFLTEVRLNLIEIEGKPYILSLIRDITAHKIAENKLKEFQYFFENSNDLLAVTNTEGYFEIVNQKMLKSLEFSLDEIVTKEYDEIIHPDFVDLARKEAENLRNGNALENFASRMLKKDGSTVWIEWNVFINQISGKFYSIGRDISERKKFEEQLALSSLIVNSSHDAIISISMDKIITSWNSGAKKMFGYKDHEIIGKTIYELMTSDFYEEHDAIFEKVKNKELIDYFETQRIDKSGNPIEVSLTLSPIIDETNTVIAVSKIIRNISTQKSIESEKLRIMNDLIQRNRDLEQFTNIISHNLRAPVANIIGINNYMMQKNITPAKKYALDIALKQSVLNLDNVIRDLNFILQVRRDINEQKTEISLYDLVEKIKTSISNEINDNKVQFIVDFTEIDTITTIKSYLYSIFFNLISNSIKYKKADKNPVIEIKSEKIESKIILKFKDNGLGFDSIKSGNQIFGLYKRFHMHVEGKGLGLFMVKSQVESLGGKISVVSELNVGTEFTIEFEV